MIIPKLIAILGFIAFVILCTITIKDHIWYKEECKIHGWKWYGVYGGKITVSCSEEERKRLIEKHNKISKERANQYRKRQECKEKF